MGKQGKALNLRKMKLTAVDHGKQRCGGGEGA